MNHLWTVKFFQQNRRQYAFKLLPLLRNNDDYILKVSNISTCSDFKNQMKL